MVFREPFPTDKSHPVRAKGRDQDERKRAQERIGKEQSRARA